MVVGAAVLVVVVVVVAVVVAAKVVVVALGLVAVVRQCYCHQQHSYYSYHDNCDYPNRAYHSTATTTTRTANYCYGRSY